MVVPISPQLRDILKAAHAARNGPHVIQFHGRPVASIKTALRNAARRAKMPYGLRARGATFHTLRHLAATARRDRANLLAFRGPDENPFRTSAAFGTWTPEAGN